MYKWVKKNQHYTWLICSARNMKNIALKKSKDMENISNISKCIEKITYILKKILTFTNY